MQSGLKLCIVAVQTLCGAHAAAQPRAALAEQIDLARLVDLAAQQGGVAIEYDPARVQGRVAVRNQGDLSVGALWAVMNRSLAARQMTTVRLPGSEVLVVVAMNEAASLSRVYRLEALPSSTEVGSPGFVVATYHVQGASPERVIERLKAVLSRTGSTTSQIGDSDVVLIADLLPRLEQARDLLKQLDGAGGEVQVSRYTPVSRDATGLAADASDVMSRAAEVGLATPRGSVYAEGSSGEVVILAAPGDVERWGSLLRQLDRAGRLVTVAYSPGSFGLNDVASLMESVLSAGDGMAEAAGGGAAWTLVRDGLTNTLLLTGEERHHAAVRGVLERLESAPAGARRTVRHFSIRHRAVGEVLDVLQGLLEQEFAEGGVREPRVDATELAAQRGESVEGPMGGQIDGGPASGPAGRDNFAADGTPGTVEVPGAPPVVMTTDESTNTLIAIGEPRLIAQIEELLRTIDVRQPQVMLEVVLVSLSDAQTRSLGVEMAGLIKTGEVRVRLASLFGISTIANGLPGGGVGGAGGTASVLAPEDFAIVLRALETVNHGRSLSNPRVLVGNGQQASLNSTLGQPVTSVNASDTVATTSFAGFSDAGTQVSITPRIAAGDHLLLEYSITLSAFVGESPGAGIPPPRQQNQLQSVVSIPDGYTVVVGGIELATEGESENRVPLLGRIPVIGEAFRSRNWNENRQRFFVFIRAEVDRGRSFEGLRYISEEAMEGAGVDDWPAVEPRLVR